MFLATPVMRTVDRMEQPSIKHPTVLAFTGNECQREASCYSVLRRIFLNRLLN